MCGVVGPDTYYWLDHHGCNPNGLLEWAIEKKRLELQNMGSRQELLVTTFSGTTIKVLYTADMTVQQLKQALQQKTGIDVGQMGALVYNGKPLNNGLRLSQYHIQNRSTVVLKSTVPGGQTYPVEI
jgi:hypothetical protein